MYAEVRRAVLVEGKSKREVSRIYGINRRTVSKMCEHAVPPGYVRKKLKQYPKLGGYIKYIEEMLRSDEGVRKKQRHTSRRIYNRLKAERGYEGSYDAVRKYVREVREVSKEVYVPLEHKYGAAQCDFGECMGEIGGEEVKLHYFVMSMCKSGDIYAKVYIKEDQISWLDGHVSAFEYFGGVPKEILYDNASSLVKKVGKYRHRELTKKYEELKSHYLFEGKFANPGKGNEKGQVEGKVGYVRRNYLVPKPKYDSIVKLNQYLEKELIKRRDDKHHKDARRIVEILEAEKKEMIKLPEYGYEVCDVRLSKVSSCSMVRYKNNDYSVPVKYAYKDVTVKCYSQRLEVFAKNEKVAEHKRLFGRNDSSYNYQHYLPLLMKKSGALDQALPMQELDLGQEFERLKKYFEGIYEGNKGKREYIKILELLKMYKAKDVEEAIKESFTIGVITVDGIKQILYGRDDQIIKPLDQEVMQEIDIKDICVREACLKQYDNLTMR